MTDSLTGWSICFPTLENNNSSWYSFLIATCHISQTLLYLRTKKKNKWRTNGENENENKRGIYFFSFPYNQKTDWRLCYTNAIQYGKARIEGNIFLFLLSMLSWFANNWVPIGIGCTLCTNRIPHEWKLLALWVCHNMKREGTIFHFHSLFPI